MIGTIHLIVLTTLSDLTFPILARKRPYFMNLH